MHFLIKMPENDRENIFRDKKTIKKVPLMFPEVKVLTKR